MGFANPFLLLATTPDYYRYRGDSSETLVSTEEIERWMYWMDELAITHNILGGSKFTWLRQLGSGNATSFTPQNSAPWGLGGTLISKQVYDRMVANTKTFGSHFGWDFSEYPPANMQGRQITYSGGQPVYGTGRTVPGFAGATPTEDFVGDGHKWAPHDVHDYGAFVRQYSNTQFPNPNLSRDYYECFPFMYGPFPGLPTPRTQRIKNTINYLDSFNAEGDWQIKSYTISKTVEVCNTAGPYTASQASSAYSSSSMLSAMNQAWSAWQSTPWTVTENETFAGESQSVSEASATWYDNDPNVPDYNIEYYALILYKTHVNIFCTRDRKIVEIFGADTSTSRGANRTGYLTSGGTPSTFTFEDGAWATISNSLGSYYTLDLSGYNIATQATRVSTITNMLTNLFNATWNNFNPSYTINSMVNDNSDHLLFDMKTGVKPPTTNPFPTTANKIHTSLNVSSNSCQWGGTYGSTPAPLNSASDYWYGKALYPGIFLGTGKFETGGDSLWNQAEPSGLSRWNNLEPHLFNPQL